MGSVTSPWSRVRQILQRLGRLWVELLVYGAMVRTYSLDPWRAWVDIDLVGDSDVRPWGGITG